MGLGRPPAPFIGTNGFIMNYLKTSMIGLASTVLAIAGAGIANAQVAGGGSAVGYGTASNYIIIPNSSLSESVTAIGSASSPTLVIPGPVVKATGADGSYLTLAPTTSLLGAQTVSTLPANYTPGYYNYLTTNYAAPTAVATAGTSGTAYAYPGVPNTGGPVTTSSSGTVMNNISTGTYVGPSFSSSLGFTGGVSIPAGYSASFGPNGALVGTGASGNASYSVNGVFYPGAPNTGGSIITNGTTIATNGQVAVSGVVTTVTPTAIAIVSGNQTWTVRWTGNTTVSATGGISTNVNGTEIRVGDFVEVNGYLDQTFVSQIDATSITDTTLR
jgi:hypothetical protein